MSNSHQESDHKQQVTQPTAPVAAGTEATGSAAPKESTFARKLRVGLKAFKAAKIGSIFASVTKALDDDAVQQA